MFHHFGDLMLRREKRARQVYLQRIGEARFADFGAGPRFAKYPGVVETDVEAAKVFDSGSNERLVEDFAPDVARHRHRLAARIAAATAAQG